MCLLPIRLILVDFLPTANITSKQKDSSYIVMSLNVHCIMTHFRADAYVRQLRRMDASGLTRITRILWFA